MKGVEKIEKVLDIVGDLALAGKKINADKKIDMNDLPIVIDLLIKVPGMVAELKELSEVKEEIKDIDVAEVVKLINKVDSIVKKIDQA